MLSAWYGSPWVEVHGSLLSETAEVFRHQAMAFLVDQAQHQWLLLSGRYIGLWYKALRTLLADR